PLARTAHLAQVRGGTLVQLLAVVLEERLAERVEGDERPAKVVRDRIAEGFELPVDRGESDRSLLDQCLELGTVTPQLLLRAVQLDEHAHLGPHDRRHNRREYEV